MRSLPPIMSMDLAVEARVGELGSDPESEDTDEQSSVPSNDDTVESDRRRVGL